ncbi:MAG: farnesyl diphosphate synthase [Planctomycetota bacterium]|nr:farnesyl diphosphate synthase [Planctomycetota bacterium]
MTAGQEQAPGPFEAFAVEWRPRIESALERLVPPASEVPQSLHAAMRYSLFPGGKRLRPILAMIGCRVTDGNPDAALASAAALELLHTYSLVHDDLPCMDDDDLRRGRPTCHQEFDEATAILAGDALLTLAFEATASGGAAAVQTLAKAAGSLGMVGGQAADLIAEGVEDPTLEQVQWIHDHKTGALIAASLVVGAQAGGGDLSDLSNLERFGELVGRAFQIVDDCLDLTGSEQNLGKRPGQDLVAAKATYPAVMGLSASQELAQELVVEAEELARTICSSASGELESRVALLRDVAQFTISRVS